MKSIAALIAAIVLAITTYAVTRTDDAGRKFLAETAETKRMFAMLIVHKLRPNADVGAALAYLDCVVFKLRWGWAFKSANDGCKARFAP